ncbi:MAG: phage holin family protein [Clostridia bacterium]|nr:phage holin family protein [Clostridia bacterium]
MLSSISNLKLSICTLVGMMGGAIARLLGGWSEDMATLVIFMSIDFAMGLVVAGIFKKSTKTKTGALDSHESWKGLCKKGVMLAFVMVAHRIDLLLGTDYIRTTAIIGFITNEAISIVENAGLMGLPLPEAIKRAIEVLKGEENFDKDNSTGV